MMRQRQVVRQKQLFEEKPAQPAVELSQQVQEQLRRILLQWLQELAKAIDEEHGDEQDHR